MDTNASTEQSPGYVDWETLGKLVGSAGTERFSQLWYHLGFSGSRIESLRSRFAPSVVARSEVLLFATDIPRFALRVYLDARGKNKSFVNLRRMMELQQCLRGVSWLDASQQHLDGIARQFKTKTLPTLRQFEVHQSANPLSLNPHLQYAVADGVIEPFPEQRKAYWIVTHDFGWVSGEGESIDGVFFASTLVDFVSGATCVASCAAMITAHAFADDDGDVPPPPGRRAITPCVQGLAEVTAVMAGAGDRYLRLGALIESDLVSYFSRLDKSSFAHPVYLPAEAEPDGLLNLTVDTLRTYVRSGFPCVMSVRGGESAGLPYPNHAVVVAGVIKPGRPPVKGTPPDGLLLVNDPGTLPLENWPADELVRRAVFDFPRNKEPYQQTRQIVVLPAEVKVPYRWAVVGTATRVEIAGVVELSAAVAHPTSDDSEFLLGRTYADPSDRYGVVAYKELRDFCGSDFFAPWNALAGLKRLNFKWMWFEKLSKDEIWLWDAQQSPPPRRPTPDAATAAGFKIARFVRVDGEWGHTLYGSHAVGDEATRFRPRYGQVRDLIVSMHAADPPARITPEPPLVAGLITSVFPTTLRQSLQNWPEGIDCAELYGFMHRDDEILGKVWDAMKYDRKSDRQPPSVVDVLAFVFESDDRAGLVNAVAAAIQKVVDSARKGLEFRAMATFVCAVLSENPRRSEKAHHALVVCGLIADRLNRKHGHRIDVIEIVGGSRVTGLISVPAPNPVSDADLYAVVMPVDEMPGRLVDRLKELCACCEQAGLAKNIVYALELEPGPLFSFNGSGPSLAAVEAALGTPGIAGRVGLNVDIAHCVLAGLSAADVFGSPLADLVCHLHISDHGTGHFADAALGDCGFNACEPDDRRKLYRFAPWVHEAWKRANRSSPRGLPFSGMISIELEAARRPDNIGRAAATLLELLRWAPQKPSDWPGAS